MLEMYRRDTATPVNVEKLRATFDDAQHKIARAGIENPAATGQASAWHCARMAWLVIDPVENHLNDHKIAIFLDHIKQKQDIVRGFFAVVRNNKLQL